MWYICNNPECTYETQCNSNIHKHVRTNKCLNCGFLRSRESRTQQQPVPELPALPALPRKKLTIYADPLENEEATDDAIVDLLCNDATFLKRMPSAASDLPTLLTMMASKVAKSRETLHASVCVTKRSVRYLSVPGEEEEWRSLTLDKYARAHAKYYFDLLETMCRYSIPRRCPDLAGLATRLLQTMPKLRPAFELYVEDHHAFQTTVHPTHRGVVTTTQKNLKMAYTEFLQND